ncbi:hypothetical protein WT15_20530 [Burkholderia stagnalis]|uniref:hypothetical protein n=1 Tax=Burkholderia stagnalis TaxID=1503054 RepID=UPI0007526A77|nr:hypothetical protein [Burkholderia stagnalis]AOK51695.1 hypothetical protein WT74_02510 [Burkholderia stagnalis]KVN75933.1 hypothetical protein WT15_20530 [Burkholderia stagnalis]KWO31862.1 hypothetical protein WT96_23040 [Burkholderia stagnalis]KWO40560.1 hypothetical protein WT95_00280 [Burkholderia stagnalis]
MLNPYVAIGRAVMMAQTFETAMVPIFELFKIHMDPGYHAKTGGYIPEGAFKAPMKNILKELAKRGSVAPELEAQIDAFIESRHKLIHRCIQTYGWPDDSDDAGFAPIVELAGKVEEAARSLTRAIVGYVVVYAAPEWAAANPDEYKAKMAGIFQHAGV